MRVGVLVHRRASGCKCVDRRSVDGLLGPPTSVVPDMSLSMAIVVLAFAGGAGFAVDDDELVDHSPM